jgi:hypothetical protein
MVVLVIADEGRNSLLCYGVSRSALPDILELHSQLSAFTCADELRYLRGALCTFEGNQVMARSTNITDVVQANVELFMGLFVAATMGVCQGVIGVAGGASLCCTGGDCPMG